MASAYIHIQYSVLYNNDWGALQQRHVIFDDEANEFLWRRGAHDIHILALFGFQFI